MFAVIPYAEIENEYICIFFSEHKSEIYSLDKWQKSTHKKVKINHNPIT